MACAPKEPAAPVEINVPQVPATVEAEPEAPPTNKPEAKGSDTLLAVMVRDGTPVCDGDETSWQDLHSDGGFTHLRGDQDGFARLLGQPFLARGVAMEADAAPISSGSHPCAPAQMRSDWVVGPNGIQSLREMGKHAGNFEVQELRALRPEEFSAVLDGDSIVVKFANPLDQAIENFEIVVFYEGCRGKPGASQRASKPRHLDPQGPARFEAPVETEATRTTGPRRGGQLARSVGVRGHGPGLSIDFEIPLSGLGVELSCQR